MKRILILLTLFSLLLAACASAGGSEPPAVDEPTLEPTANPDEPVSSDDPTPRPSPTVDKDSVVVGQPLIDSFDILILESFPVQVNVEVHGNLPDGCTELGPSEVTREESTFQVTYETYRPAGVACTEALVPFDDVVSLPVGGLEAGVYTVNVYGITESFELAVDNVLNDGSGPTTSESPLSEAEKAELVRLTLERALVAEEIPDFGLLTAEGTTLPLSTANIDPAWAPELPGFTLLLMTPEEIQAKADADGDFLYLSFQRINGESGRTAVVSLDNTWAVAKDSTTGYLSGGGFTIEYTHSEKGWEGEIVEAWIS